MYDRLRSDSEVRRLRHAVSGAQSSQLNQHAGGQSENSRSQGQSQQKPSEIELAVTQAGHSQYQRGAENQSYR